MPDPATAEGTRRVVARARAVGKSYPDGRGVRVVLEDVDVEVRAGVIVGVQGPSGCGKTTLLEIVAGLLRPDQGTVEILGEPLDFDRRRDLAATRRDHIGLISQDYRLLPDESVAENVALPLRFGSSRPRRAQRRTLVAQALQDVTLDVDPRRTVRTLSGGERQRVAIARALVRSPGLLIADEPTAALDADTAATIVTLLQAVAGRGTAVLLATHDPAAAKACDVVHRFAGPQLHQDVAQPVSASSGALPASSTEVGVRARPAGA